MTEVGTVAQLWRYPVKSFQGEQVDELGVAPGRRRRRPASSPSSTPPPRRCCRPSATPTCCWPRPGSTATGSSSPCPTAREHASDDPGVHDALSAWLGMDVRLEPPPADEVYPMEMYTGHVRREHAALRLGRAARHAGSTWPTRTGSPPPAWPPIAGEHPDGAVGRPPLPPHRPHRDDRRAATRRRAGPPSRSARRQVEVLMPTMRCSMPSRAQPGLDRDKAIGTTIRDAEQQQPGRLRHRDQERNGPGGR